MVLSPNASFPQKRVVSGAVHVKVTSSERQAFLREILLVNTRPVKEYKQLIVNRSSMLVNVT